MLTFDFFMPTRIIFGPDRLSELERTTHLPQGARALIVVEAGGAMLRQGHLARVQGLLAARGVATMVYDGTGDRLESATIDAVAARARDSKAAFIVGLGSDRVIDAAKGAAFMARASGRCWDYATGAAPASDFAPVPLPMVAIPATAESGAAFSGRCIVLRAGGPEIAVWRHSALFPHLAVVDPELTLPVPAEATALGGLGAFCQAAETLLAPSSPPAADMLALEAVQIISRYLPRAAADGRDGEARTLLTWASAATGMGVSQSFAPPLPILASHLLERGATGHAHGAALALLAESYFEWAGRRRPDRAALLADAMGAAEGDDGPARFAAALRGLTASVGLPSAVPISPYCDRERIARVAWAALAAMPDPGGDAPPILAAADVETILEKAFRRESNRRPGA